MKIPVIVLAVIFFTAGVVNNRILAAKMQQEMGNTLGIITETSVSPSPLTVPSPVPTTTPSAALVTLKPSSTPTAPRASEVSSLVYPDATVISTSPILVLETTVDPQVVTDWYKERIRAMGLQVKSFVQTSTNGNVENKLAGAGDGVNIKIEITKKSNSQTVHISVTE